MKKEKSASEILVKVTAQGFSLAIHGIKSEDGSWLCALEKNEITFTEIPADIHVNSLGELRDYKKSDFEYTFDRAFMKFDNSEWFLCHPGAIHPEFTDFIFEAYQQRIEEYNSQYPADSPMERFIRDKKTEEWRIKTGRN